MFGTVNTAVEAAEHWHSPRIYCAKHSPGPHRVNIFTAVNRSLESSQLWFRQFSLPGNNMGSKGEEVE